MTEPSPQAVDRHRIVRLWLLCVAALMVVVVLVGGATRLTESGLSIVEWKPVVGTLPPLSEHDWQAEFEKYRQIPQYRELNRGMTLDQFKTIFWWEWTHRLLARTVGFVFLLPFLFFLWRGWIARGFRARLWTIFGMGGALGAVGWWMVSSGLTERVSVSQYRLAFHLTLACAIYAAIVWTAQEMVPRPATAAARPRHRFTALALVGLVVLQIYLGALVAGLDAGLVYNTWPLIDGSFIPDSARLFFEQPAWRNLFENTLTVQFNHRMAAYLLFAVAIWHALDMRRAADRGAARRALLLAAAMTVQALIGIATLVHQTPISLALLHQGTALIVLTIAVVHAEGLRPRGVVATITAPLHAIGAKT